ncbi:MAG TPA: molybdopterin cofactor-binding domain-containing protein, partial [Dehalococcoidia bacterium]|nr:molybdopterin cofactor-binding domain-containing protein [Dehalococcoidia bacterium]
MVIAERESKYEVIGTRPIRPDGVDKVTGRAQYGNDVTLPGTLYGKVLRSPYAHARILSIDTSKAEALPGVKAVVTHRDLPTADDKVQDLGEGAVNLRFLSANILADDKTLYRGHAVAAVAATNIHIAEEAIGLIEVEYDVLPPVIDVRDAMLPEAPLLHENLRTRSLAGLADKPSNVASHLQMVKGDVEAGFAEADEVIEREFRTPMFHQGYIEPHACSAQWNQDGQLTIWTSTQGAFPVRAQVSEILRVPVS